MLKVNRKMFRKFIKADRGVAAIEAVLIMPFLFLLYFSLQDLTALITFNRKITSAASSVADTVGQSSTATTTKAIVLDDMNAVNMIMAPTPIADVHVDIYDYRVVGGAVTNPWKMNNGSGPACAAPIVTNMPALMASGNDLIVAVACMNYSPFIAAFMGTNILGATTFKLQQTITSRPRATAKLDCYVSGTSGTVCS